MAAWAQRRGLLFSLLVIAVATSLFESTAKAQSFGIELQNTLMPASGGMAGTSVARPQDLLSAINGNPGTMTQFEGTQFSFSGAWADPTIQFRQDSPLPVANVSPYEATSAAPGTAVGNIGLTQNFDDWGKPITFGLGLISTAGGGVDFRSVPQSNGTSSQILILHFVGGMAIQVTDRLSIGATAALGQGFFDAPYAGVGAMAAAYGVRGSVGAGYELDPDTTLGFYYQTAEQFVFEDAVRLALPGNTLSAAFDVNLGLPANLGFGVANSSLMDGNLLLAADITYKLWDSAALFKDIYQNQWVFQTGAQYSAGKCRYRLGYAYAENPIVAIDSLSIGSLPIQDLVAGASYLQAQLAVINQHRLSGGIGFVDVLPGVNFDLFAGCMFHASQQLTETNVSASSYFLGAGLTWRFGACSGVPTTSPHN